MSKLLKYSCKIWLNFAGALNIFKVKPDAKWQCIKRFK